MHSPLPPQSLSKMKRSLGLTLLVPFMVMVAMAQTPKPPSYHGGNSARTLDLLNPLNGTLQPRTSYDYVKQNPRFAGMVPKERKCLTTEIQDQQQTQNAGETESDASFENWIEQGLQQRQKSRSAKRQAEVEYTLPTVVHVIYANSLENISDEQVLSQIEVLNQDYRRENPDQDQTPREFRNRASDTHVEFCMAKQDPDGNPTNGINRVSFSGSPFSEQYINEVIKPSTVWDPNRYFNIWVCHIADEILGFAQFPVSSQVSGIPIGSTSANTDGVVITFTAFGTIGTASAPFNGGRTATHEVGHWLGLRHIWGDGDCDVDDYCNDTPIASGANFNCPPAGVSCSGNPAMVSNFMDYTDDDCMNLFTRDQQARMRMVLENSPRRRSLLESATCQPPVIPPTPAFVADIQQGCAPLNISFTDQSLGEIDTYEWQFSGGKPATSREINPSVVYKTPGRYPVTLTVSNAAGRRVETKTGFIEVLSSGKALPFTASFENAALDESNLQAVSPSEPYNWSPTARVSGEGKGAGALTINNFDNNLRGSLDWLLLPVLDLTGAPAALTFKVAYAPYDPRYSDTLGVFITTDCGTTFRSIYWKGGQRLATTDPYAKPFTPQSDEWRTESIDLSEFAGSNKVRIAFVNLAGYGNDIYLDDISVNRQGPPAPSPNFTLIGNKAICAHDSVSFSDRSTQRPTRWVWSFPGGIPASDTTPNPVVYYPEPGTYPVTLTVSNGGGTQTTTREEAVVVRPAPIAELMASRTEICKGEEVTLTAVGPGPFSWNLGKGNKAPNSNEITLKPKSDAIYSISSGPDAGGCVTTSEVAIRVGKGRELKVSRPEVILCRDSVVTLEVTGADQYRWFPTTGLDYPNSGFVKASPTQTTTYTVTGKSPGCTTSKQIKVVVEDLPNALAIEADRAVICPGETLTLKATGAVTYSWTPGVGLNTRAGREVIAMPPVSTTYRVTGTSARGCKASKEIFIQVAEQPSMRLIASNPIVCPGDRVEIMARGASNYQWSQREDLVPSGDMAIAYPTEFAQYTVIGKNREGCADTSTISINVHQVSPVKLEASRYTLCPNDQTILTSSGAETYAWGPVGRVKGATPSTTQLTVSPSRDQTYFVVGTDQNGCKTKAEVQIDVSNDLEVNPQADFNTLDGNTTTCAGLEVKFVAQARSAAQYVWEFEGGTPSLSLEQNPTVRFQEEGLHGVKLTVRSCAGREDNLDRSGFILVAPAFELSLNADATTLCYGDTLTMEADGALEYEWSPATFLSSTTGNKVQASPTQNMIYSITARDGSGCEITDSVKVEVVGTGASASVKPFAPVICRGGSVALQAQGGHTYNWYPQTGLDRYNAAIVTASPEKTTTYTVRVTTLDGCVFNREVTVTVEDTLPIVITADKSQICKGDQVSLKVSGKGVHTWAPAYGLSAAIGNEVTAYPEVSTTYTITSKLENGCTAQAQTRIEVLSGPELSLKADDIQICLGSTTELIATGKGPFIWEEAEGLSKKEGAIVQVSPKRTTTYTVRSGEGSCQAVQNLTIEVKKPKPLLVTASEKMICKGSPVVLAATSGARLRWRGGPGVEGNFGRQVTVYPNQTKRYTVSGLDDQGCESEGSVSVQVQESSFLKVQSSASGICQGKEVELIAQGAESYLWKGYGLSASNQARVYARPSETTRYTVIGTDSRGCKDTAEVPIQVGKLDVTFQMSTDRIDLANSLGVVDFTDLTPDASDWKWSFGQGSESTEQSPVHVYDQVDTYVVTLQASNGVCTGRAQQTLVVVNSSSLETLTQQGKIAVTPETNDGQIELVVDSPRDMYLRLRLLDGAGMQVVSAALRLKSGRYYQRLDLSSFEKGEYQLQLLDGQETLTRSIVYR